MPNKENFYSNNYNQNCLRDKRKSIYVLHSEEKTELHLAAIEGDLITTQELLNGGIYENNYFLQDKDGNTPIHLAAEHGHKDCLKAILKKVLSDIDNKKMTLANSFDIKNSIGDTALHSVIRAIHKKNDSDSKDYLQCVKLLISCTNTNIKNDEKQIPLCLATSLKLVEVSRIFVKNGYINCDIEDEYDFNAYDYIKNSEDLGLIDLFHSYYQERANHTK
ncbi:MAG: ankyrin repeat domain-containing protein [Wolbachia endosymbiont of Fragariocoptes setiger]|nr:ankyrin repeat domain-containing protein [Wolbachia endosymbiont of Fragariocoptes setiger]